MKKKLVFNNRILTYEKPHNTIWTDKLIQHCIDQIKKGFTYSKIAKELEINKHALESILHKKRNEPKWAGKIPYIKITQRPIDFQKDKIGILDIETHEGFYANRGFMISYCIKEHKKENYKTGLIDSTDIKHGLYDKKLCEKFVKDILNFDVIVGYYSGDKRFDLPYVRTRCLKNKIEFPFYNTIKQIDLYTYVKTKFKLTRNTLEEACKVFGIKGKTHIDFSIWQSFVYEGNKKSGQEVLRHNILDCKITDRLFEELKKYGACGLTSI